MTRPFVTGCRMVGGAALCAVLLGCDDGRFAVPGPGISLSTPPARTATEPPAGDGEVAGGQATHTEILRGSGRFIAPPPSGQGGDGGGAGETGESGEAGPVSLNFVEVDVHEVARAVLGDILGRSFVVDAGVQGPVTVETARPVPRDAVLPVLENGLRSAGLGLVERGDGYAIVPLTDRWGRSAVVGEGTPGLGTEAVSLRYVAAAQLAKLLEPVVATNAIQADEARNVILLTGTGDERASLRAMIAQFDVNWMRGMSFAMVTLQRSDSHRVAEELNQILNAEGAPTSGLVRLIPVTRLNGIVAISPQPDYLEEVRFWAEQLDREGEGGERRLFVYRVQNGNAADLAEVLGRLFGAASETSALSGETAGDPWSAAAGRPPAALPGAADGADPLAHPDASFGPSTGATQQLRLSEGGQRITLTSDDANNAIVVYATAREYDQIVQTLQKLDILPRQVLIEAVITEVSLNDTLRFGVEWYFRTGESAFSLTSGKTALPVQSFPGFSYLLSQGDGIRAVLNALDEVTTVNVVSSPQLLVLNNQTATLQVGDQVPIATRSAVDTTTSDSTIVNSIEYRDTGVILKVTPRVNDSGLVLLDIAQEVSDVSTTTTSTLDSPTIQQRRVSSSVAVQDGQTIALGGLIRDNLSNGSSGIPVLKDIPVLGSLFGATSKGRSRTELLILLTPRVVRDMAEARALTDELRRKISSVEPIRADPLDSAPLDREP
jgi:general secretion pathway protein D